MFWSKRKRRGRGEENEKKHRTNNGVSEGQDTDKKAERRPELYAVSLRGDSLGGKYE